MRFGVFILLALATSANAAERPNIVFLMADDQCTYSMGCYGNEDVQTPNLDRLARDGMVFDNHYDTTAICMGSRANVVTGLLEYRHGCNFGHGPLLAEHWRKSYPMLLREAGYLTAFAGKIGFEVAPEVGRKGRLPAEDFDAWGAGPGQTNYVTAKNPSMKKYAKEFPHSTRSYGAFGRDFIRASAKSDKPFCLSISFKAPHRPVQPDPMFDDVYRGKAFTKPGNFGREHGTHFSKQSRQGRQYERFFSWNYATDYDQVMALYHQQVYAIDVAVGMIREALETTGEAANTVIIYTSDNGFLCGSHGYGSKVLPYEESSRVPLIIYDPRHENSAKQLRSAALTGNIDFAPTILALANVEPPKGLDGVNLLPLYDDPKSAVRETLPLINVWGPDSVHSLAVLTKEWKYIFWAFGEPGFSPTEELYHLSPDPLELDNVADDAGSQKQLQVMRSHYDQAVEAWRDKAAAYHNYQKYGTLFERTRDWEAKKSQLRQSARQ